MVISGYSPISQQIGVSSGIAALSAWHYLEEESKILLIQTGFHNNLEETLLGMKKKKKEGFFETKGIDEVIRMESIGKYEEAVLERSVLTLHCGNGKLDLLSSTTKSNQEIYENELKRWLFSIVEQCKEKYDYIFIDIGWQQQEIQDKLEEIVDKSLYFFPQNRWVLEQYEQKKWKKNQHIVLSKYIDQSFFNETNIKILFPKLGTKLIGAIPFQASYMDSWSKGNSMQYLSIQCDIQKKEKNLFWSQISRIAKKLKKEDGSGKRDRRS